MVNSSPICSLRSPPLVALVTRVVFHAATKAASPFAHIPIVAPES